MRKLIIAKNAEIRPFLFGRISFCHSFVIAIINIICYNFNENIGHYDYKNGGNAMKEAKMQFAPHSIYEMVYLCVMQLLGNTK